MSAASSAPACTCSTIWVPVPRSWAGKIVTFTSPLVRLSTSSFHFSAACWCVLRSVWSWPSLIVSVAAPAVPAHTTAANAANAVRRVRSVIVESPCGALRHRFAVEPEVVGPARNALGEQRLGAGHVARAEARLEQGVVEDVALRAAAADLHDARAHGLDAVDDPP